jgi:hypothetical protein
LRDQWFFGFFCVDWCKFFAYVAASCVEIRRLASYIQRVALVPRVRVEQMPPYASFNMLDHIDQLQGAARARLMRIGACFGTQASTSGTALLPALKLYEAALCAHGLSSETIPRLEALLALSAEQPRERAVLLAIRQGMCERCTRCVREAFTLSDSLSEADPLALADQLDAQCVGDDETSRRARQLAAQLRAHLKDRAKIRGLPADVDRWDMIEGAIVELLLHVEQAARAALEAETASGEGLRALARLALVREVS